LASLNNSIGIAPSKIDFEAAATAVFAGDMYETRMFLYLHTDAHVCISCPIDVQRIDAHDLL
jgi:hypothetical protein